MAMQDCRRCARIIRFRKDFAKNQPQAVQKPHLMGYQALTRIKIDPETQAQIPDFVIR